MIEVTARVAVYPGSKFAKVLEDMTKIEDELYATDEAEVSIVTPEPEPGSYAQNVSYIEVKWNL